MALWACSWSACVGDVALLNVSPLGFNLLWGLPGLKTRESWEAKGQGEQGAAGYCPKILFLEGAKTALCPFHRSHRALCARNRPDSETNFRDDFWGSFLSRPLCFTAQDERAETVIWLYDPFDCLEEGKRPPTPKTRFSIWTLLRTPGRFTTRPLPVYLTTKMSVVRPFSVLSKDEIGPQ